MQPRIVTTPWPGMAGELIALHGAYYAARWNLDQRFECQVGQELCAFLQRPKSPPGWQWAAGEPAGLAGFIALQAVSECEARLRWFIVSPKAQGLGLGRRLLDLSLAQARASGLARLHLWTFAGLDAARALYERAGFRLTQEEPSERWGPRLVEQRFDLDLS